jgi:hypothetical protein
MIVRVLGKIPDSLRMFTLLKLIINRPICILSVNLVLILYMSLAINFLQNVLMKYLAVLIIINLLFYILLRQLKVLLKI